MSKFAIGLTTLVIYATSLSLHPLITTAQAATSSNKHVKKHRTKLQESPAIRDSWSAGQAWSVAPASSGVCPGMGRSFDCKIWPPPFADDPDRKIPGRR
jgi:hypothetical protein